VFAAVPQCVVPLHRNRPNGERHDDINAGDAECGCLGYAARRYSVSLAINVKDCDGVEPGHDVGGEADPVITATLTDLRVTVNPLLLPTATSL
jgi:hypothetical protein